MSVSNSFSGSPFTDDLLQAVVAAKINRDSASPDAWPIPALSGHAHSRSDYFYSLDRTPHVYQITIESRFRSPQGPQARHEWIIKAETIEVAWALMRLGIFNERSSSLTDNMERAYFVDGSTSFLQGAGTL